MTGLRRYICTGASLALLGACAPQEEPNVEGEEPVFTPEYLGVETRKLDEELVSLVVRMKGARGEADISDYARCAAAQYTLIRGLSFARHIRTIVKEEGGIWSADAVYTLSESQPDGLQVLEAKSVVAECRANDIPTV